MRVERDNGNTHSVGAIDFDRRFNCSRCATAFAEPTTALFSSNSPIGACPECEGFGRTVELDLDKVIPNHNLLDAQRADRAVADAGVSRDERLDAEAGAAQKNPHVGAVSRDDRRGAHLAARRRRRSAREVGRRQVAGRARLLQVARRAPLQDSRANSAREISPLRHLPGVRRRQAQGRGAQRARGRQVDRRRRAALDSRSGRVARQNRIDRRSRDARGDRDARAAQSRRLPARGRARLSDGRAAGAHAVGRRGAADSSGERARQRAGRDALCARRADCRPARGRRAAPARGAVQPARFRQHGGRRRARSGDDRGRGSRRRARPRRRQRGRRADVLGTAGEGDARQHGVVAGTRAADARAGEAAQIHQARSRDSNRRRARAQSRRHRRGDPGWPHGLRDRSFRIGKIDAGRGRALQQLPAPHRATPRRSPASANGSTASS